MSVTTAGTLTTGHVGINVTDVGRSADFYRRVLGFEVLHEGRDGERRWVFLGQGGTLVLTLWQQADGGYDAGRAGLHHLSFQAGSLAEVREKEAVLRELGAEFAYDGVVPHGEGAASGGVFFHDPDGVRLEIYAPSGAESADAPVTSAPTCGFF
ncbi:VOC family protein [Streptomyces durbertensis]|uniref:VOC family protein n=1 Tax=Streptomyces durbertensis TaxID=2448886 RepID=A0ABR6EKW9_9ACTN|nr:VOC family protein [Streptomyces durbertensis]MBB1245977.1 VOC family protein [Streptomyces durbertensis]